MSSIFRRYSNSARLGDLLVQAGVLTPNQLQEAVKHSRSKKLQIGQVLVMSGHLTPKDLQVALEAQSMLRDKTIDINIAVQCIKVARKIGANFADVLEDYDPNAANKARTGKLGELLVEAGIITQDQLTQAMEQGFNTGMPLGRMLVLNEAIPSEQLEKILDIQVRLRDEMMSREEAVVALRQLAGVSDEQKPAQEKKKPEKKQIVRLGELLVMAGILSENDVMDSLEYGLANNQPIGAVLVSQQLISQELLDAALFFQTCVKSDELDPLKACECLSEVFSTGVSPEEAIKEVTATKGPEAPDKPPIDYRTLITMSRAVTDEEIDKAFAITSQDAALIGKVLVLTGFLDVPTLQATLRCYQMVSKGWIKPDDAIAALDFCLHQNQTGSPSFEQALRDLKWSPEAGLQMRGEKNLLKRTGENIKALAPTGPAPGSLVEKEKQPVEPEAAKEQEDVPAVAEPSKEAVEEKPAASSEPAPKETPPKEIEKESSEPEAKPEPEVEEVKEAVTEKEEPKEEVAAEAGQAPTLDALLSPLTEKKSEEKEKTTTGETEPVVKEEEEEKVETATGETEPVAIEEEEEEEEEKAETTTGETKPVVKEEEEEKEEKAETTTGETEPVAKEEEEKAETTTGETEPVAKEEEEEEEKKEKAETTTGETEPVAKEEEEEEESSGGGLGALLQGIGGGTGGNNSGKANKPGGLLGGLIQKTDEPEEPEPVKDESEKQSEVLSEPSMEELAALSAEELIAQIADSTEDVKQHDSAKGKKRTGRFSETILPEAAKARQLAALISKESTEEEKFDKESEEDDALGTAFERLAERHFEQGNYKEAQVVYERILVHKLNDMGPENVELVEDYNNLAMTLCVQGLFDKAEPFMKKAVSLYENQKGADLLALADYLHSLGTIHYRMNKLEDAEQSLSRVLELRKQELDPSHEDIGKTLADYAKVVKKLGQSENAEAIYKRAKEILRQNS